MVAHIPAAVARKLDGIETVEGTINDHPFRATLDRVADGSRELRVNQAMLRGAAAAAGGLAYFAVLGPEPKLSIPTDLRAALAETPDAMALWSDLSALGRRDWVRWIEGAKTEATRARRIRRTTDQLAEGKRRPCCVNVYEYALTRIEKDAR